jgi:hypothetical protein
VGSDDPEESEDADEHVGDPVGDGRVGVRRQPSERRLAKARQRVRRQRVVPVDGLRLAPRRTQTRKQKACKCQIYTAPK